MPGMLKTLLITWLRGIKQVRELHQELYHVSQVWLLTLGT